MFLTRLMQFLRVGVNLERNGQARVAEDELSIARRDAQDFEERRDGVPNVVELDQTDTVRVADAAE